MVAFLLVTALLAAATAVFAYRRADQRPAQIAVRVQATGLDRWVRIDDGEPVAAALLAAGALGHDGRLLSAKDHVVLDPRVDPAVLTVDGKRVDPASVPVARDVVAIVDGKDRVEPTRTVREAVEPAAMDDVLVHVTEKGVPGTVERVLGATSGEVVSSRVIKAPIAPKRTDRKVVALTFDDGPSALWTAKVLAVLKAKGVHATFCEIGTQVADQPQLSKAIVDQGHQLCNHTLHHDEGLKGAAQAKLDEEIGGGAKAFTDHGLPAPSYYRPPGGFLDDAIKATVRGQHEQTLYWKVDTEDWRKGANTLTILRHVLDQVEPGAIILMHDGGGAERQPTIDALGLAIDHLKAEGYEFTFPVIAHS
ncbi:polysaccharide deacetylase family protein [Aquihabitans sp. G128]|uniref:polysaccharide deacetylase family protein n=1 Tax=Aquihabitans sp. G128 TaxID=2849779 RepID=UPI001C226749|nr:polysaccharide deacetylase family protein [Aquihabitans sp. G128]QXC59424.1 polysaccharide deacetylase family protein [Aquihabitans sp. G128]